MGEEKERGWREGSRGEKEGEERKGREERERRGERERREGGQEEERGGMNGKEGREGRGHMYGHPQACNNGKGSSPANVRHTTSIELHCTYLLSGSRRVPVQRTGL